MVNGPKIFAKTKANEYFKSLPHQPDAKKALERRLLRKRNRADREFIRNALKRGTSLKMAQLYLRVSCFTAGRKVAILSTELGDRISEHFTLATNAADVSAKHLTITRNARSYQQKLLGDSMYIEHFTKTLSDVSGKVTVVDGIVKEMTPPGKAVNMDYVIGLDPGSCDYGIAARGLVKDGKLVEITSYDLVNVDNEKRIVNGQG